MKDHDAAAGAFLARRAISPSGDDAVCSKAA